MSASAKCCCFQVDLTGKCVRPGITDAIRFTCPGKLMGKPGGIQILAATAFGKSQMVTYAGLKTLKPEEKVNNKNLPKAQKNNLCDG